MSTTLRSRHKRAARVTPAVLLGLSLLAACDTDQPTAPETTKASSVKPPSAYWSLAPGAIAFNIVDESQVAVTGWTSFWLIDSKNDSTFFEDNNAYFDSNPVSGSYLLKGLTPGTYQVCQHNSPTYYLVANPACLTAKVTTAATTVIGPFVDLHQPKLLWKVVDDDGMLVPGATFVLTDSLNNKAVMTDNGIYDGNKTGGLWQTLGWPQTLKLCETVPPPGYVLPAQPCLTFVAKGGFPTDLGKWVNNPIASVKIEVLSDKFYLIGPSTFKIYGSNTITTVDDNGPYDLEPKYGLLKVKLPAAGTYNVCETSAPYGFDPPSPPCKGPITVPAGVPVWAPLFINKPWPVPR
jgi:hypothetical protein